MDDIVLSALLAESKTPEKFAMSKDLLTIEPLAIMMRKDDPSFKQLVDAGLITREQRGRWSFHRVVQPALDALADSLRTPGATPAP